MYILFKPSFRESDTILSLSQYLRKVFRQYPVKILGYDLPHGIFISTKMNAQLLENTSRGTVSNLVRKFVIIRQLSRMLLEVLQ